MDLFVFFQHLLDPEKLIHTGGLLIILLIIFIENGVFFGFFLPGDTLLFTAGLLCATHTFDISIYLLVSTIIIAAISGNLFGYFFGRKVGENFIQRKDTLLFKKKYIYAAEIFFKKYGGMALIMGRFLPIIRTFAPIFAGIVRFDFKKFIAYNASGGILWVTSMTLGGYFLGMIFPELKNKLEYIIGGIVIITWIPVITAYLKGRSKKKMNP
jgi:membrane-associated protein